MEDRYLSNEDIINLSLNKKKADRNLNIRLTDNELMAIKENAMAAGLKVSAFIINRALGIKDPDTKEDLKNEETGNKNTAASGSHESWKTCSCELCRQLRTFLKF